MLKGAIFDMDGTLIDSMEAWETVGERYLKTFDIIPDKDFRERISALSLNAVAPYLKERYGIERTYQEIKDGINKAMEDFYFNESELKNGVLEFLEKLKSKGVKMCLATATDRYLVEKVLKRNKIDGYFDRIFTCSEVNAGKTKPDIFREAPQAKAVIDYSDFIDEFLGEDNGK